MKKLIAWILMLCMVMGLLCGCDMDTDSSRRRSDRKDRDDEDEIVEDWDDEDRDDNDKDKDKETKKVTIEEVVVYDENDVKLTVTDLKVNSFGHEIKIKMENNTEHNLTLSADAFVVNGISIDGYLYVDVAAGKKANGTITFYSENLEIAGIEYLATVECVDAHIYDSDSYDTLYECPFSIETSIAGDYVQEIDDSGDVIFEDAGVTVISKGFISDGTSDATVILLVKNETGRDIVIEAENVSVNGYTMDGWMYDAVMADTVSFCDLSVWSFTLEENDIENVEELSFSLSARYTDEWSSFCESDELTISAD